MSASRQFTVHWRDRIQTDLVLVYPAVQAAAWTNLEESERLIVTSSPFQLVPPWGRYRNTDLSELEPGMAVFVLCRCPW